MMFRYQEQNERNRYILPYLVLLVTFLILWVTLFSKTIIGHKYYASLSEANRTKEQLIIAPRGVFFDSSNKPLVANDSNPKHGYERRYLYPEATAHLLGYLSLPDKNALQDYSCGAPPLSNQFIGKTGLEKYFECELRGYPGKIIYETDALGEKKRELARVESKQGGNIKLSVSLELQRAAYQAFSEGLLGGAIATDPKTGAVLLYYSSPGFDSNLLLKQQGLYEELSLKKTKPMFNRLGLGLYPPGSVIKPLIALGALESKVVDSQTRFIDEGIFKLGGSEFGNWYYLQYGKTDGEVNVVKAIKRSNDIYFYHLGVEMGVNKIIYWLTKFGLKEQSLQKFFPQSQSLLPNSRWKQQNLKEPWYLGDTVNLAIGQGYLLVNPTQMHLATAIIANNGIKCDPYFNKSGLRHCENLEIEQEHINSVVEGMVQACSPGGTGWPFFDYKINNEKMVVACKTGTAESPGDEALPHAWFTVFAPAYDPEIVLTILVEHGGEGSATAAPIAKQILNTFFKEKMIQ